MIDVQEQIACLYCGGNAKLYEKNAHHPYAPGIGMFQIYQCISCSSLLTFPVPAPELSAALYSTFDQGMHKKARELRTLYPLRGWFRQCMNHMISAGSFNTQSAFSWIDIGAGQGEMCALLMHEFPLTNGAAVDFHERPLKLHSEVSWMRADLNRELPQTLTPADLVFAITVFEHMADPVQFIRNSLNLLKPGGVLYFNCPRSDSNTFRLMRRKWPYYLPGEHITVPSIKGLENLMHRECRARFEDGYTVKIDPVIMPYPLGFYLGHFFPFAKKIFPSRPDIFFPTGMLECTMVRKEG